MSERFKELVLKTSDSEMDRGFESHPLRHLAQIAQSVEQRTENPSILDSEQKNFIGWVISSVGRAPDS